MYWLYNYKLIVGYYMRSYFEVQEKGHSCLIDDIHWTTQLLNSKKLKRFVDLGMSMWNTLSVVLSQTNHFNSSINNIYLIIIPAWNLKPLHKKRINFQIHRCLIIHSSGTFIYVFNLFTTAALYSQFFMTLFRILYRIAPANAKY